MINLNRLIRILGHLVIIFLAISGILLYQLEREIRSSSLPETFKSLLSLPVGLENRFYDLRMQKQLTAKKSSSPMILAAIDDEALKAIGRWPWSRESWAQLVSKFRMLGAKVLAFDVIFPEKEKFCPVGPEGDVGVTPTSPDLKFAQNITQFQSRIVENKVILSYSLVSMSPVDDELAQNETPGELFEFMLDSEQQGDVSFNQKRVMKTTFPIPELISTTPVPGLAFIGAQEDSDGIFRRYPLVANIDSMIYPSFGLSAVTALTGEKVKVTVDRYGNGKLLFQGSELELSPEGETPIRWSGGVNHFEVVSLAEIWKSSGGEEALKKMVGEKLVYIGSTAYAAHDLRHTPVDAKLPGIYFHMNMSEMLLKNYFYAPFAESLKYSWMLLILGLLLIWGFSLFKNAIVDGIVVITIGSGLYFADNYWLISNGYKITLFFIYMAFFSASLWNIFFNFYMANKDKRFLKQAFGNYLSPELIEMMHTSGEKPSLGGTSALLTAYFTDIQGFSTFSEKLSPTRLVELLNEYLTAMTDILLEERGTLDKYEGDAIIAFFGAPVSLPDHAIRASTVALKMQNRLNELRVKWSSEGDKWPIIVHDMRMRIGLNSGEMVVGNMGSRSRMNYTMMGDAVNLAARLEAAAKQYGIFIHASKETKELTGNLFEWRELDTVKVVGKSLPVMTYELLGESGKLDSTLLKLQQVFMDGIKYYKLREWEKALILFNESLKWEEARFPELSSKVNPSKVYIERTQHFKENPPLADWDGVYTLTSK